MDRRLHTAPTMSTPSARFLTTSVATLGLLYGCGTDPDPDPGPRPEGSELERAIDVVRDAATYVSFDYSANGCHDRSILLAAELAAAGIPSNAQFIVAQGTDNLLTPSRFPGLEWSYHVAPVIYVDDAEPPTDQRKFLRIVDGVVDGHIDRGAYILDPALYPDQIAAPLATWVADLTGAQQSAFLSAADAREALDPPSSEAIAQARIESTVIPEALVDMPRFWQFQMSSSCSFLSRDAQELADRLTDTQIAEIRRRMNVGVIALIGDLLAQDLLLEVEPIPQSPCWDL